jgi:hypothetical protein
MATKPVIVVLDDMKARITWLRRYFDSSTNIIWRSNVTDFIAAVEANPSVKLIILDHDLDMQSGSTGESQGPDGLTGMDATSFLPARHRSTEILVWSRNGHGAADMTENLQKRGFGKVTTIMYGFDRHIWTLIKKVCEV